MLDEFAKLYQQWAEALRAKDVAWFESIEDDRFSYLGPDGSRKDKTAHLRIAEHGARGELATTVESAEVFGDIVIVTGEHWVRSEVPDDAGLSTRLTEQMRAGVRVRFSSVWTSQRRLLHHHTTPLRGEPRADEGLAEEIDDVYRQWRTAMSQRDSAWVERTEHANFHYTGSDGTRKGKRDHIRQVTSARDAEFRTKIRTVDEYGDTVVVTGDHWARAEVDADQADLAPEIVRAMAAGIDYAFTSVWIREAGELRLAAHHTSERRAAP
ncbi:nuclear transport factor 2 family protein [Amycolatopsis jejuensis]|uniref:nuclear transport factor 2 family protein n=1 Tax=Amycolatopsis jejuensis TaxID=330084 RepID=UPI000526BF7E|nr:nuclear transport factor 2 family protein [Amycolatopsis jejuensis]